MWPRLKKSRVKKFNAPENTAVSQGKNILLTGIRMAALIYIGLAVVLFFNQRNMFYHPSAVNFGDCPELSDAESLTLANGARGYFKKVSPERVVVMYHGNAGSACDRAQFGYFLASRGYSFFIAEYAGFGGDRRGGPAIARILADASANAAFIETQNFSHVVLLGESLGASVAAYHGSLSKPNELVLITPMVSAIKRAQELYPFMPISLLLRERYDTLQWASAAPEAAVTIIHGRDDAVIPVHHGERLYQALPQAQKELAVIERADHNDLTAHPAFWETLERVFEQPDDDSLR